jgi:hypothetical protein
MSEQRGDWLQQVSEFLSSVGDERGVLLVFPEYRPDLAKTVAQRLALRFYDFRAEDMAPKGVRASETGLYELDSVMTRLAAEGGAVVFNVEALLGTKGTVERVAWIERFVRTDWVNPLLVPMTLFAQDVAAATDRVLHLREEELPSQSLVSRLIN